MNVDNIVIFGVGAMGSNVLLNLIRDLPGVQYTIVDFDTVEERNYLVGTQPYLKSHLRKPKTQSLAMLAMMQDGVKVNIVNKKITNAKEIIDIVASLENFLIIDAFDNAEARNLLHNFGNLTHRPVLHAGFSPLFTGEAVWNDMYETVSDYTVVTDICTQMGARSFIMSLSSLVSVVILDYAIHDNKQNIFYDHLSFTIKELK